ncbi:MAG TPA: DUF2512 family protein [Ureibacillus sp.]|nr:DUF2512 family protein [Ureibacillus sp.]
MQYTKAFFIKVALTVGTLAIVLGLFFNVSLVDSILTGIVLTIIAFIGDMFVLPKVGNMIAAGIDLVLTFLVVWVFGSYLFDVDSVTLLSAAVLTSLFIAAGELYYHRYLRDHVFENVDFPNNNSRVHHQLQTEFSEDFDSDLHSKKKNDNA